MSQDGKRYIVFIMSLVINGLEFEKNRERNRQLINMYNTSFFVQI